jgi:hypothetical protein
MREIRQSGSEGGGAINSPYPYLESGERAGDSVFKIFACVGSRGCDLLLLKVTVVLARKEQRI